MLSSEKILSIIIPMYNTEKYITKCLDSVLKQSYSNLEIIVVDDCSKDEGYKIVQEYMKIDNRIKYVKHETNKGLFQARVTGSKKATGEYIAFLDSDDYISVDFYRTLMYNIVENKSDIAMGNTILEYDDGRKILYNLFDCNFNTLVGEDCIKEYFKQEGLCFAWHTIWNKIYSKEIWDKAVIHYEDIKEHFIMTEDFAFSTVLFYYSRKLTKVQNDAIFYCKHDKTSTDIKDMTVNKFMKNISDLMISFEFVERFMKKVGIYDKYGENFKRWKGLYKGQQKSYLKWSNLTGKDVLEVEKKINQFCDYDIEVKDENYFSSIESAWDDRLEKIKQQIANDNIKCVSFDIFDTLIVRPFYIPSDLFRLMDKYFKEISHLDTGIDFSKIRINCELIAREELKNVYQDITIDEIYDVIHKKYKIDNNILQRMKQKEIEYEIKFCTRRNTGYELYQMALEMGKKVILTSDMYLDKFVIKEILKKNGYNEFYELFLSSELRKTKVTGDLYKYAIKITGIEAKNILHIGDNYYSDIEMAQKQGLKVAHLKKSIDVFLENRLADVFIKDLPDWQDNKSSMNFMGIRTMIAVVANKYFDNPYRTFNKESIFNADPCLIGYYALGMHLFGISNWIAKDVLKKKYDSVVFMARDGYLPMKAYDILRNIYPDLPESKYLYVSRKSLIPASILNEIDLYKLSEVIDVYKSTPISILKYIENSIKKDKNVEKILEVYGIKIDENFKDISDFNEFISVVIRELFDKNKNDKVLNKIKKYFKEFFIGKSCTFDVGYSARPEMYISKLLDINLDTYFINVNHDEEYKHARIGKFELNTFFDYKPTFTGNVRELVLSNTKPSCIGYDVTGEKATPIFEKDHYDYKELLIINRMQENSIQFVKDIINIFGENTQDLIYQNYYISLPHESYIHSPADLDKRVLSCIYFEDDLRAEKYVNVVEFCNNEMSWHNQHRLNDLLEFSGSCIMNQEQIKEEARYLILQNRSRTTKLIYYLFFDRVTLRRRFKEIFHKHKIIMGISNKFYKLLKKIKKVKR